MRGIPQRLLAVLKDLRDYGNTLVVVEHDPEMILGADHILDIGPRSGREGGHVVFEGNIRDFMNAAHSQTAYFLKHPPEVTPTHGKTISKKNGVD